MSKCSGSLRTTPQSLHLWTLTRYVQNPHSRQKALWCVLTPTILAENINRIETKYSRRRARRGRVSATSFPARTMSKRLLALRCGRQNCQPSILYIIRKGLPLAACRRWPSWEGLRLAPLPATSTPPGRWRG